MLSKIILKPQSKLIRTKYFIEKLILKLTGDYQWINGEYSKNYFDEMVWDLKIIRDGIKECKFERDRDELFQYLVKKYQEEFCPSAFYKYFSNKNKLKYLDLRMEIDKLLSRKNQALSDFSTIQTEMNYN